MTSHSLFTVEHRAEEARTGHIHHHRTRTRTPTYLIHTQRGGTVPNITADLLQETLDITHPRDDSDGNGASPIIAVHFWDMFENANATTTLTAYCEHLNKQTNGGGGSRPLHRFLNMERYPLFLALRDPLYPHNTSMANDRSIHGDTDSGRKSVELAQYTEHLKIYGAEMAVMMCDHGDFSGDIGLSKPSKKMHRSVERTVAWMLEQTKAEHDDDDDDDSGDGSMLFFTVVGGPYWSLRKLTIEKLIERISSSEGHAQRVKGINLGDFGAVPLRSRFELLRQCLELINSNDYLQSLPKLVSGMDDPVSVLESVQYGIDMFDGTYPFTVAESGMALVFPLRDALDSLENSTLKINLRDSRFRRDLTPLMDDCKCPCCALYTKAYVHHLLNCHEMLAEVILSAHNLHRYLMFFNAIQKHIADGTLQQFKQWFLKTTGIDTTSRESIEEGGMSAPTMDTQ